jgi:hypothetical protein
MAHIESTIRPVTLYSVTFVYDYRLTLCACISYCYVLAILVALAALREPCVQAVLLVATSSDMIYSEQPTGP